MDSKEVLSIYMKAFAENLKRVRTDKFDKMSGVSKNSGFNKSNYSKYEHGIGNPTIETILKMAIVLEIEPKDLFDFKFDIKKYNIDD